MAGNRRAARDADGVPRFAWLSDPHLSPRPDLEPYRRRFDEAVAGVRRAAPDFTLITGDLVDQADTESYGLFRQSIRELPGPVYVLPGNHDVGEKRFAAAPPGSVVTAEQIATYCAEVGPPWHAFEAAGRHFLLLTSSLFGSGLKEETAQWEWLERELASRRDATVYLAFHHPLFLQAPDEPGGTYWNVEPEPRARLLALLERHAVRAVFTGHIHRNLRHRYQRTELLTQTAVSFGLGDPDQRVEGWSLVTLRGDVPDVAFHPLTPGGILIREAN